LNSIVATCAPTFTHVPKPMGGTRTITHLAARERARYAQLVSRIAHHVERSLTPLVATDRLSCGGSGLEGPGAARRRFANAQTHLQRSGHVLARVDIRDCFPSIAPATVERSLLELGCHPSEVAPLRRFLEELVALGVRGIPVGPRGSGVLANAVLQQVDRSLERQRVAYARWVDDILVAAAGERQADEVVARIAETLSVLDLRLNPRKTRIAPVHEANRLTGALLLTSSCGGHRAEAP